MPDHKQEKEVPKSVVKDEPPHQVCDIVANHIAAVMMNRSRMQDMEHDLDKYVKTLSQEDKQKHRDEIRRQLTDGRLALEGLLQRFLAS
jgi:hypothetical protein